MGQYWYILSVDSDEFLYCGKLGDFLLNKEADCLVDLFAVPVKPSPMQIACATKRQDHHLYIEPLPLKKNLKPPCQIRSHIAAIPDELILMIFGSLDLISCFRLSLVSIRFWRIGWPFFQRKIIEIMSPWAGKRVICMGDYCESNDFPAGFLTTEERDMINKGLDDSELDPDDGIDSGSGDLLNLARARFQEVDLEVNPYKILLCPLAEEPDDEFDSKHSHIRRSPCTVLNEIGHLPESLRDQVNWFAFMGRKADYYPRTESWILRNLNTAEIVLGNELFAAFHGSERQDGLHLRYPGFGEAIMSRICWSRATYEDTLHRGVWAGHRFEICTEKSHASNSDVRWKDVTSEIIDELSVVLDLPVLKKSKNTKDQEQ